MNEFYNKLQKIVVSELDQFKKEISKRTLEETVNITKEITLKNGLVIRFSKLLTTDIFVRFYHKNDIDSYTFDELIKLEYIPKEYQTQNFLEVHSSSYEKIKTV